MQKRILCAVEDTTGERTIQFYEILTSFRNRKRRKFINILCQNNQKTCQKNGYRVQLRTPREREQCGLMGEKWGSARSRTDEKKCEKEKLKRQILTNQFINSRKTR